MGYCREYQVLLGPLEMWYTMNSLSLYLYSKLHPYLFFNVLNVYFIVDEWRKTA